MRVRTISRQDQRHERKNKCHTSTLEKQIDEMVYNLYGPVYRSGRFTPEEIEIVEGKGYLNIDIAEKNIFCYPNNRL